MLNFLAMSILTAAVLSWGKLKARNQGSKKEADFCYWEGFLSIKKTQVCVLLIRMSKVTILLAQSSQERCHADVKFNSHPCGTARAFALC